MIWDDTQNNTFHDDATTSPDQIARVKLENTQYIKTVHT